MVHTEIVLQRDGCECLRSSLYLHTLFGLDSLVQAVRVTAALHDTACLLIHNLYLTILGNDILYVAVEHGICLEQLVYGVYTLRLDGVVGKHLLLLLVLLLGSERGVALELRHLCRDVREYEEVGV